MSALVTLEQAKRHLRVTSSTSDDDIELKVEQASGIVLDYLKGRAHLTPAVTAIVLTTSIASPTVVTTQSPHVFVNGQTVIIAGHVGSVPDINGSWAIANVTASSFTIPAAVTTAGAGGTATIAWTEVTVPAPVQAATLLMLGHIFGHRGDDAGSSFRPPSASVWDAVERLLVRFRDPALA